MSRFLHFRNAAWDRLSWIWPRRRRIDPHAPRVKITIYDGMAQ